MVENLAAALRLLLVTDDRLLGDRDPVACCRAAVEGGVTAVQLRLKHADDRALLDLARTLVAALPVPVFINDRVDIALLAGAAGVHLGADDLAPDRIAGRGLVVGASVGDRAEAQRGAAADYWGIGPLHGSSTKVDAGGPLELDGAAQLLDLAAGRPCVAIGGVTPEDVAPLLEAGFAGVAVASGILGEPDIREAARRYVTMDDGRWTIDDRR